MTQQGQETFAFSLGSRKTLKTLQVAGAGLARRVQSRWRLTPTEPAGAAVCTMQTLPTACTAKASFPAQARFPAKAGVFLTDGTWTGAAEVDFAHFEPGCSLRVPPEADPDELLPWVNMLLPDAGVIPLHASAFTLDGRNVAVSGFAHSGKTGVLLAAAAEGARIIGDECIWLSTDGRVHGLDVPAEVQLKYVDEFPAYRSRLPSAAHRRARWYKGLARCSRAFQPRLARKLAARARVCVPIEQLFREPAGGGRLDHLFLSVRHEDGELGTQDLSTEEAAARLLEIVLAEFNPVLDLYAQYRYLFPGKRNAWLDGLETQLSAGLGDGLCEARCHLIRHPYPLAAGDMLAAIRQAI